MPNPKIRIVPDTGFLVAAALKNGYARSYLVGRGTKFLAYELFTSQAILVELQNKLEDRFGFNRDQVATVLQQILSVATVVYPHQKLTVVRDPDDNKILECALEAQAHIVVSFDKDLLDLKEYQNIKIVHPSQLKYLLPDQTAG